MLLCGFSWPSMFKVKRHFLVFWCQLSKRTFIQKTHLLSRPRYLKHWYILILCGFLVVFVIFMASAGFWRNKLQKQITRGCVSACSLCGIGSFLSREVEKIMWAVIIFMLGPILSVTVNFLLTCHIVNHYSGLNAGYELKRPGKGSFFVPVIAVFVCFWQASCDDISRTVFPGCFQ